MPASLRSVVSSLIAACWLSVGCGGGGGTAGPDGGQDAVQDSGTDAGAGGGDDGGLDSGVGAGEDAGAADAGDAGRDGGQTACVILGQLQSALAVDPGNPCQLCDPAISVSAWSLAADGQGCGNGQLCLSGSCQSVCEIDSGFYDGGTLESGASCRACQPTLSATAWTALPNGTACGAQTVCANGACVVGCTVNGFLLDAGTINAENPCEACAPAVSTSAWSRVADGASCGLGTFCFQGFCVDGCLADGGGTTCGCATGKQSCGGAVIDTCVDDLHCGDCTSACAGPLGCFGGVCTIPGTMPTSRHDLAAVLGSDGRIYAIGGIGAGVTLGTVEAFDPRSNLWSSEPSLTVPRYGLSAAVDSTGTIYAMLGDDLLSGSPNPEAVAETLSPGGSWLTLASPPYLSVFTAAAVGPGGVFYLPGGESGAQGIDSNVYTFDPMTQVWAQGPSLPVATSAPGVTAGLDGTIYVLGGTPDYASPLDEIEALAPGAGAWGDAGSLLFARCQPGAATDPEGLIYTIGGDNCEAGASYDAFPLVEAFDPTSGSSSAKANLPNTAQQLACATGREGRIYCLGGWDGFQDQNFLQIYDVAGDYWVP